MSQFKNNLSTKDQKEMSSQQALALGDAQFPDLLTPAAGCRLKKAVRQLRSESDNSEH